MKRILALISFIVFLGCGDSATEPGMPNARGSFTGDWSFVYIVVATGATDTVSCPGRIGITAQEGDRLTGEFSVDAAAGCEAASGDVTGLISAAGDISLGLEVSESEQLGLENVTGCEYVGGRTSFQGSLAGDELSAATAATFDCPAPGGQIICYNIGMTIHGTRG